MVNAWAGYSAKHHVDTKSVSFGLSREDAKRRPKGQFRQTTRIGRFLSYDFCRPVKIGLVMTRTSKRLNRTKYQIQMMNLALVAFLTLLDRKKRRRRRRLVRVRSRILERSVSAMSFLCFSLFIYLCMARARAGASIPLKPMMKNAPP